MHFFTIQWITHTLKLKLKLTIIPTFVSTEVKHSKIQHPGLLQLQTPSLTDAVPNLSTGHSTKNNKVFLFSGT